MLAGHLLRPMDYMPDDMIFYNMEQAGSAWMGGYYLQLLKTHPVWDYSQTNIAWLAEQGIAAKHCEVGYSGCLTSIVPQKEAIELLHYGSLNPRRQHILNLLEDSGIRVHHAFNVYGEELDALIAQSRVVLNCHFYPAKIFEITRCGYLFSNRKCVVSEIGVEDEVYRNTGGFCTYDRLVEYVTTFVRNDALRQKVANEGFEIFSKRKQSDFLKAVL